MQCQMLGVTLEGRKTVIKMHKVLICFQLQWHWLESIGMYLIH